MEEQKRLALNRSLFNRPTDRINPTHPPAHAGSASASLAICHPAHSASQAVCVCCVKTHEIAVEGTLSPSPPSSSREGNLGGKKGGRGGRPHQKPCPGGRDAIQTSLCLAWRCVCGGTGWRQGGWRKKGGGGARTPPPPRSSARRGRARVYIYNFSPRALPTLPPAQTPNQRHRCGKYGPSLHVCLKAQGASMHPNPRSRPILD